MTNILSLIGGGLTILWGIAHLIPTKNVVRDFGDISEDNRNIVRMEWINEGATLIFIGLIIIISILVTGSVDVFLSSLVILMLIALSIISIFTGFKVNFLPFKLCPVIFLTSALLICLDIFI